MVRTYDASVFGSMAATFGSGVGPCVGIVEPFKQVLGVIAHPQMLALELRPLMGACPGQYGTSTSCHSTRGPHRDHCHPGQPYYAHNTLLIGRYGARIVTYSSVVKFWFTLRALARAVAPDSPIPFVSRL